MLSILLPKPTESSPPMFESRFIDRFSRVHPATVPLLYVPAMLGLLYWAVAREGVSIPGAALLFSAGLLSWSLAEYWLHRKLFHWVPAGKLGERMHFILHGVHHDYPNDKLRLVFPTAASVTLFFLFLGIYVLAFGSAGYAIHAGFVLGYMIYDLGHYYLHHFQPKWKWARAWRRHHMMHHAQKVDTARKFGVSSTLWDHVFRTY